MSGEATAPARNRVLSLAPWALLALGWGALTVTKLANLATTGALAGLVVSLTFVAAGVGVVADRGTVSAGRLVAGSLFLVGALATLVSASGTWLPDDAVTVVADVTILAALLLVLALKTERGARAVAG